MTQTILDTATAFLKEKGFLERIYVDEKIADRFIELFVAEAEKITAGAPGAGNYGPATMPEQIDVIASHIADALKRGSKALLGGKKSVQPPYVQPVVLVDVPEDAIAMTEETFGPVAAGPFPGAAPTPPSNLGRSANCYLPRQSR